MLVFSSISCDPISLQSPPQDYDTPAPVDIVVSSDSVAVSQPVEIQIGYESLCPGDYRGMNIQFDSAVAFYSPIYHVYPQNPCSQKTTFHVTPETTTVAANEALRVEASGRYGVAVKYIFATTTPLSYGHHLHYQFFNKSLVALPYQTVTFHLPSRGADSLFVIKADSTGTWDTTFTDNTPVLPYGMNSYRLNSIAGPQQSGVMVIQ
jgi:hypothetical protein